MARIERRQRSDMGSNPISRSNAIVAQPAQHVPRKDAFARSTRADSSTFYLPGVTCRACGWEAVMRNGICENCGTVTIVPLDEL